MATSFRYEFNHTTLQDPKLAKWWAKAAEFRSSGTDRLLAPAPWTRTITELCADGVTGEAYAHEQIQVPPGRSAEYLEIVRQEAVPVYEEFGWELAGAWETLMIDDSECFLLWAIPTWEQWAEFEKAQRTHPARGQVAGAGPGRDHLDVPLPAGGCPAQPLPHPPPAGPLRPDRLGGVRGHPCPVESAGTPAGGPSDSRRPTGRHTREATMSSRYRYA